MGSERGQKNDGGLWFKHRLTEAEQRRLHNDEVQAKYGIKPIKKPPPPWMGQEGYVYELLQFPD